MLIVRAHMTYQLHGWFKERSTRAQHMKTHLTILPLHLPFSSLSNAQKLQSCVANRAAATTTNRRLPFVGHPITSDYCNFLLFLNDFLGPMLHVNSGQKTLVLYSPSTFDPFLSQ